MRRILGILLIVLIVVTVAGFAARWYLTSKRVADQVAAHIETIYGGNIELGGVDVGLGSTSLNMLKLLEAGDKSPWLEVAELQMDISIIDYLKGNSNPGKIRISGAKLLLRFSRDGRLLTTLPDSISGLDWQNSGAPFDMLPVMEFAKSQVTIRTEGCPDQVFRDVSGKLDKNTNQMVLTASADNAAWGKWAITGLLHKQSAKIDVQFKSQGAVHVTQAMLEQLALVPAVCWQDVQAIQFDTPALVHLEYDLRQGEGRCRAEFDPVQGQFHVKSLGLHVANVHGKVILDDNQLLLRGLKGEVFAGTIGVGADLTFHADSIAIDSRIEANRLDVSQFPPAWGLSPGMTGKLTGIAVLKVVATPPSASAPDLAGIVTRASSPLGSVEVAAALTTIPFATTYRTAGSGKGQIVDAAVGQMQVEAIHLELHAVPGGFRFGDPEK